MITKTMYIFVGDNLKKTNMRLTHPDLLFQGLGNINFNKDTSVVTMLIPKGTKIDSNTTT